MAYIDYQRVFEQGPAPLMLLSPENIILDVSDAYCVATMVERSSVVGRHLFDVFPDNPDDPTADGNRNLAASLERVRRLRQPDTMPTQKYDVRRPESEGGGFERRYWSPSNHPVFSEDGKLVAIVHQGDDVTELTLGRQQASETEERASGLEQRLFLRSQQLEAANARLLELDRMKSSFLSRMSHELRTPLNALIGFAQLLELDGVSPQQSEPLSHILRAGRHLLGLINDVLDISRIEAGHMNVSMEAVSLDDVVRTAVDLVRPMAEQLGVTFTVELDAEPRYVYADRGRAVQVLVNLVSNAVKYNRPNGSVRIHSDTVDGRVRTYVEDTGVGISDDQRHLLFHPFERLGKEHTEIEGSGVGLTLARDLANRMAGDLELASTSPSGSTFVFELAAIDPPSSGAGSTVTDDGSTADQSRPITVLYVEDNIANLKLVAAITARMAGVTLVTAMQGRLGIATAHEQKPDLILLDAHLPDINGDEVLLELRGSPEFATTPIVFLSADALPAHVKRLTALGADGYLTKPFDTLELMNLIDRSRPS